MDQLQNHKKEIETQIVETMISALENEKITESESSEIAAFVLDRIDAVTTTQEMTTFLQDLAAKWEIFGSLLFLEQADLKERVEDEVAAGVLLLAEHGKLDDAIRLARSATNSPVQQ